MYDIDGVGNDDFQEDDKLSSPRIKSDDPSLPNRNGQHRDSEKRNVKSSKQILMNAGQTSEFDSGMNNSQINVNTPNRETRSGIPSKTADTTYCTPVYGQIVSSRENHNQINDIQEKIASHDGSKPSTSFRQDWNNVQEPPKEGWDEISKHDISVITNGREVKQEKCSNTEKKKADVNGKPHYDFFPIFQNKNIATSTNKLQDNITSTDKSKRHDIEDNSKIVIEPMQKLVLHSTDNKICDNKTNALSSIIS